MTHNVGTFNSKAPDMKRVAELISRTGPVDILLLQEVPDVSQAWNFTDDLTLKHCIFAPYSSGPDGLAIISRFPLRPVHFFDFNRYAAMAVEADVGSRNMLLLNVHLQRVISLRISETDIILPWKTALKILCKELTQETPRTRAVKKLLAWISIHSYKDIIIAGDFNTVPFSKTIRTINGKFKDALWPGLNYFNGSYNKLPFFIEPRIDYIFHSPGLKCFSADIIEDSSGDHFPVKAVFDMLEKSL
jgi:endonuclease/exonuclease/phosphatase family metal-dependent hydrolase